MRDNPRYSIIPAGAVFDPRLQGGDLRVLCLLGCHSNKLGWCEATSQGELAAAIDYSRQTFQRSIVRLVEAGWVQTKTAFVSQTGRPYAPYAYRVIMDRDDPNIPPHESVVAETMTDEGAHGRAPLPTGGQGVPIQDGQGCPRMHGQQEADQEETKDDSDSAREGHSSEALVIADELAAMAGVDPTRQTGWFVAGPALIVQRWLDAGYLRWHLVEGVRRVMLKRTTPPDDIRYFQKSWQKVRGESEAPVPQPEQGTSNAAIRDGFVGQIDRAKSRSSFKEQRWAEAWDNVTGRLGLAGTNDDGAGNQASAPPIGGLSEPRRA